jgi:hypothetical protein
MKKLIIYLKKCLMAVSVVIRKLFKKKRRYVYVITEEILFV